VGINPPNWSLSVETFLYLCFPMLGVLLWRLRGLGIWVAAVSFYIGGQALVWLVRPYISHQTAMLLPPLHLSTFALGVLLARWQAARRERGMTSEPCAWQADGILVVAVVALMLALGSSLLRPWSYLFFDGLLAPIFMGIVWALSSARAMASRLLSMRWLVVLGESSYALYLIHDPLLHLFQHFHLEKRPMLYPVYLALCIGLSVLSFFYFETPSRAWLLKRLQTRSLESVEAASTAQ
jgi:peptidoglycan/LPS O-acetylase OafA/YrhL